MLPQLAEVFGQVVPSYFALLVTGFAVATWLLARWARRVGLDREVMIDLGLYALLWGVIGARLLHVVADGYFWDYVNLCVDPSRVAWRITQAECLERIEGCGGEPEPVGRWDAERGVCVPLSRDCFAWAAFWRGGLTYYGGLIAATIFAFRFLRRERMPVLRVADAAAPRIALGLFFGRIGCFLGGCCFGTRHDGSLGVRFPPWSPASEAQWKAGLLRRPDLESLPVHPTQLYEAAGTLALAALLAFGLHPRKRFDGMVLLAFLAGYAVLR
ncbi:MAG: prolipoprotein diacylglyceryl transferase, partial [Myxococcota bacterium]|nr:prolipoprotein diacylglyceryl transferase [Myxococcota bacterium]